jgi:hypothetical protein
MDWKERWRKWDRKRQMVIRRAGGVCERCKRAKGVHVHHHAYLPAPAPRRSGDEPMEWLQLVCLDCHAHYHPNVRFRSKQEQQDRRAARAKRQRSTPAKRASCRHCAGTYDRQQHHAICVKHGLA